jgi:hypothetical protein
MIVTTVVLGIIALVGVLSYRSVTSNTRDSATRVSLSSVADETLVNARRDYRVDQIDVEDALTSLGPNWTVLTQSTAVSTPGQVGWVYNAGTGTAGLVTKSPSGNIVQACVSTNFTSSRVLPADASLSPADALPCEAPATYETSPYPLAGGGTGTVGGGTVGATAETPPTISVAPGDIRVGVSATPGSRNWLMWQYQRDGSGSYLSSSTWWDFGRTNGVTYTYRVRGYDSVTGETGVWSEPVQATPLGPGPSLSATPTATNVALSWSAVTGATEYRVAWYEKSQVWNGIYVTTTSRNYTVSGLLPGVEYTFSVQAAAPAIGGRSSWQAVYSATTPPVTPPATGSPGAPSGLIAYDGTPAEGYLTDGIGGLNWAAPASPGSSAIVGYRIQYRLTPTGTWTQYTDTTAPTSDINIWWAPTGASIYWRVAAVNASGTGTYSASYTTFNGGGG